MHVGNGCTTNQFGKTLRALNTAWHIAVRMHQNMDRAFNSHLGRLSDVHGLLLHLLER